MSRAELRATLAELRAQLDASEPLDPELRDELRRAVSEIESHLEAEGGHDASFGERLNALIERFEGAHPRLAEAVGRLINGLAELGI